MSIWSMTESALEDLALPMAADAYRSATPEALPDEFMVYTLVSAPPMQHADNAEQMRFYRVQVSYFNRTGLHAVPDINGAMTGAGFMAGPLRALPFDQKSGHFGLALEYTYQESEV